MHYDRTYWEDKAMLETVAITDTVLDLIHAFAPQFELHYTQDYIGLTDGQVKNFASFRPQRGAEMVLEMRIPEIAQTTAGLTAAGLDNFKYYDNRYRVPVRASDIAANRELLSKLLRQAYESR